MPDLYEQMPPPMNYLGLPENYSSYRASRVLFFPIPYEATTSYAAGTGDAPAAIIQASQQVELYDRELASEPAARYGIHTLPALAPDRRGPEEMTRSIERAAVKLHASKKFLLAVGGEHTVSVGLVRAARRSYPRLAVLHFDAHADLRDSYQSSPYSHACALRRIHEEGVPLLQVGLRNLSQEEAEYQKRRRIPALFGDELSADLARQAHRLAKLCRGKTLYLTLDLDVLDPAIMTTGTPEPGGLSYRELLRLVRAASASSRIVSADVVEFAPCGNNPAPAFTAARLIYEVLKLILPRGRKLSRRPPL